MSESPATTTREERRAELQERIGQCRFQINAHIELAELIEDSMARCQGYQVIWRKVANRLRADAQVIEADLNRAQERLADITTAQEAASRFIRNKPLPQTRPLIDSPQA
jgi:hypothetical protein